MTMQPARAFGKLEIETLVLCEPRGLPPSTMVTENLTALESQRLGTPRRGSNSIA